MTNPTPDLDLDRILADGRPVIRCGCGLLAVSNDPKANLEALQDHECPLTLSEGTPDKGDRWYHHLFSLYGVIALFIVADGTGYVLIKIFGHGS